MQPLWWTGVFVVQYTFLLKKKSEFGKIRNETAYMSHSRNLALSFNESITLHLRVY